MWGKQGLEGDRLGHDRDERNEAKNAIELR